MHIPIYIYIGVPAVICLVLIIIFWDDISFLLEDIWDGICAIVREIPEWLCTMLLGLFGLIWEGICYIWKGLCFLTEFLICVLCELWEKISEGISNLYTFICEKKCEMRLKQMVTCPLCYEQIRVAEILFRCDNPMCKKKFTIFPPDYFVTKGSKPAERRMIHSTCETVSTTRICPNCKREIPNNIEDFDESSIIRIAIIGAKEAGKSHYMAMLIHWIKQASTEFDWNLFELTEDTSKRYKNDFYEPLFVRHETIRTTQAIKDNRIATPLVYSLKVGKGSNSRQFMLELFDAAGENLEQTENLNFISQYIYKASGIICLLDPLQLPRIREGILRTHNKSVLPMQNTDTGSIINRIEILIRKHTTNREDFIKTPLAVAFSKMDFVKDASKNAAEVSQRIFDESQHKRGFSEREFADIDSIMRSWVEDIDDTADIISQSKNFQNCGYFGLSSIGCNPKENGERLKCDPRSYRVEDPFLWILKQHKMIKSV